MKKLMVIGLLLFVLAAGCATAGGSLLSQDQNYQCPDNLLKDNRDFLKENREFLKGAIECQTKMNTQPQVRSAPELLLK